MRKSLRRTLAVLLALAMLLGDNAVVFATESTEMTETSAVETTVSTDTEDDSAEASEADASAAEDASADEQDASTGETTESEADTEDEEAAEDAIGDETADLSEEETAEEDLVLVTEEEASAEVPLVATDSSIGTYLVTVAETEEVEDTEVGSYSTFNDAVSGINSYVSENESSDSIFYITISADTTVTLSLDDDVSIEASGSQIYLQTAESVSTTVYMDFASCDLEITANVMSFNGVNITNISTLTMNGSSLILNRDSIYKETYIAAETLEMDKGTIVNHGYLKADTANIVSLENCPVSEVDGENSYAYGGVFECGSINQQSTATTTLCGGSVFAITSESDNTIYNVVLDSGADSENARFYRHPDASLAINTSFAQQDESVMLTFGILDTDSYTNDGTLAALDSERGIALFTTDIGSFPVEMIAGIDSGIGILQDGDTVYMGGAVSVSASDIYGTDSFSVETATLNEAFSELSNDITDSPGDWNVTVTIYSDTKLTGDLTIPAYYYLWIGADSSAAAIDFQNYTLVFSGYSVVSDSIVLESTAEAGGTFEADSSLIIEGAQSETESDRVSNVNITGDGTLDFQSGTSDIENIVTAPISISGLTVDVVSSWTFNGSVNVDDIKLYSSSTEETECEIIFESDVTAAEWVQMDNCTAKLNSLSMTGDYSFYLSESAAVEIGTLSMTSGALTNYGTLKVETLEQASAVSTGFYSGSITMITESAVIYNGYTGLNSDADNTAAYFYMAETADVNINGGFYRHNENVLLCYGILGDSSTEGAFEDVNGIYVISPESQTKLFSTNNSSFPTEAIQVNTENSHATVCQKGTEIRVISSEIVILAGADVNSTKKLGTYYDWSDVVTYLNTLSNTSQTYIVKLSEDIGADGALTLPSKVGKLIFCGSGNDVTLTFQGDLTLATDLEFENLTLETVDTNGDARNAKLTLNGKTLTLDGVNLTNNFASIAGTGNSALELTGGSSVGVTGTVTTKDLTLDQSELSAAGAVTVSGTLTLVYGGALSSGQSKMTLADVVSNGTGNSLEYGGSQATMLSISGNVTSTDSQAELNVYEENDTSTSVGVVRLSAIRLSTTLVTLSQGTQLVSAAKASAGWFIAGDDWTLVSGSVSGEDNTGDESEENAAETTSEEDTEGTTEESEAGETSEDGSAEETEESVSYYIMGSDAFRTYKQAKVIYCGIPSAENVRLEIMEDDAGYLTLGTFSSLQEAFTEIANRNDSTAVYRVVILAEKDVEGTYDLTEGTLTWPTKAAMLIISSSDEGRPRRRRSLTREA